ncbi:flagellar basal body L-ring protein FlgH [Halomonas sp. ATBC28]|jgi:flagellar L-ring protein precursor FlgH|uniref:Flagellar L-ring protein n=1 Tax=Vreelandella titanicae BH1 TaxID=1204738 RepID=L9U691_9GAMM|nr:MULTISPECIES: flagellar basal body L-ring protein FlgH [Halomonas]NAO98891.1 flagellar basal body L-ring protein FlgH [Halomonas sp. MG34]QGQ69017.1 flagellar basal body L-ring protein FlgH [Halomonas sp. PA16-9]ELY20332.1 Flagellar L-ring protein [Halomonas titanicae BH1]KIN13153.1 flagellar basal body L-ring protein [Halomonas sp. KHS3]MCD1587920.1 flagellar basal body L-ring protein FlgH [Halomonas sp. IOP_14]|tara:strand:- start:1629 stop:2318 length:690 start_codon:yes stop_codon:yes gene_type:complete
MLELHHMSRRIALVGLVLFLLVVAGCAQVPRASVVGEQEQISIVDRPPPIPNGSIYQARQGYQPLFEDRRPRAMGDILTIVLDEEVSASKNSQSNAGRSGSASLELTQLPDVLDTLAEYGFDISGENDFTGSGGSQANNSFTGTITVSVLEVMNNGNLRVRGEKQIAINQGTEFIRFSGVVNPRTITAQNTVPSTQVADARIEYVGDGYINEAQHMGWLQRFFLNVSPF